MAYTDDWENLMNGVFGPGGKLRFDTQKTPPEKPGLPDMNAALLEQQKKLDEMLRKQNAELRRDTTQEALARAGRCLKIWRLTAAGQRNHRSQTGASGAASKGWPLR